MSIYGNKFFNEGKLKDLTKDQEPIKVIIDFTDNDSIIEEEVEYLDESMDLKTTVNYKNSKTPIEIEFRTADKASRASGSNTSKDTSNNMQHPVSIKVKCGPHDFKPIYIGDRRNNTKPYISKSVKFTSDEKDKKEVGLILAEITQKHAGLFWSSGSELNQKKLAENIVDDILKDNRIKLLKITIAGRKNLELQDKLNEKIKRSKQ